MKAAVVLILFAVCALTQGTAQDQAAITAAEAACGPKSVKFDVTQETTHHPTPRPEAGKALVYVIEDIDQEFRCDEDCPLTKVGMGGSWVGANQGSSYFFFSVAPGEHHLCINWQSRLEARSRAFSLANFTAEEGKTYYFQERFLLLHDTAYSLTLDLVNSDEGKYLVALSAFSVSHPKK
jgi:hypothetical protein